MSTTLRFKTRLFVRDTRLCLQVQRAARAMARHSDALLRPIGLNRPAIFAANAAERGQHRTERIDYGTDGPPTSENMYAEELLRAALGDTTVPHLCSHGSITHEGRGHDGTSALIDPVAERPAAV